MTKPTKEPTQAEIDAVMHECLQRFHDGWEATPHHLRGEYLIAITTAGIGLMHDILGAEFTAVFMTNTKTWLSDPTWVFFKEPNKH